MRVQALDDLASEYKRSISWVQKQVFKNEPDYKIDNPRAANLVFDTTLHGKRKDKLETLVFKDSITKEVLTWKHIQSESSKSTPEQSNKVSLGCKYLLSKLIKLRLHY